MKKDEDQRHFHAVSMLYLMKKILSEDELAY